jgi:nicotinate phosphoribosyltransferase
MATPEPHPALFTDLYELTMAQAYWQSGVTARATFSLYFRSYPVDRAYFVLAGVEDILDQIKDFRVSAEDIDYLRSTGALDGDFLQTLAGLRFTGSVRAMIEGAIFFANEPVVEVTAPIIEAQVLETLLINQVNLQSILATKTSRVVHAARGKTVVDFGARRAHGIEAAGKLARVAYMTGFEGTSNVLAGRLHGVPTFGTMAHSFVESFPSEVEAFRAYGDSFPDASTFLVDTYDALDGVRNAITVAKEMRRRGHALKAIRLDSGDLLDLSARARPLLDEAGLADVRIFASGGLDEFELDTLVRAGAPIDGFGVGTKVGVSADAPWTDCAYKLVEYDGRPTVKLDVRKGTTPGPKQVYRYRDEKGAYGGDVIGLAGERPPGRGGEPLLGEVMAGGKRRGERETLQQMRQRFADEFSRLPERHKSLRSPPPYDVATSEGLQKLQQVVSREVRERGQGE